MNDKTTVLDQPEQIALFRLAALIKAIELKLAYPKMPHYRLPRVRDLREQYGLTARTYKDALAELKEVRAYDSQTYWIKQHCGQDAADHANYGWAVDMIEGYIATKVYGHGVLTTDIETGTHLWTPFDD